MANVSFDDLSQVPSDANDSFSSFHDSDDGAGSQASRGSQAGAPAKAPVETVTKDSFGQNKYEDKALDEEDWEFPSDDEQYEEAGGWGGELGGYR